MTTDINGTLPRHLATGAAFFLRNARPNTTASSRSKSVPDLIEPEKT